MNNRGLYIVAIIIAALSGGYYYYSGKANRLKAVNSRNMIYSAQDIHFTRVNEEGNVAARAKIDRLEQNMHNQTSKMDNLHGSVYTGGQLTATFLAKEAAGYNDNEKVKLLGHVTATRFTEKGEMVFQTDELTTYPKTKMAETTHQVDVNSPQTSFISDGLKANLETGQYEFFNIRGKYAPNS